ncbi:MAG: hypothetical protein ABI689_14595 [Thermoanaerobaculia bacterium]
MRSSRPIFSFFLFTGLLLFGCGATAAPSDPTTPAGEKLVKPDETGRFTLAVEGQAEVAPGLVLTLERIVADSRCPVDVNCVWAGEIRVAFALESPRTESPRLEFELSRTAPKAAARGLEFELLGALPVPRATAKIAAADYRIELRVGAAQVAGAQ